ncbi:hypothetical protein AT270_03105 [Bacillus cereus]|uniref:hypothetical protein n=1 Tax=Bacillus cereus TaxID=1396 RepID=UPI00077A8589|nr:hypothetical protein [Bacillus cereus]KXY76028.1 hypothetical protein AT270_03105 [Bacillus cereus]
MKCTINNTQIEGTPEEVIKFVEWYEFRISRSYSTSIGGGGCVSSTGQGSFFVKTSTSGGTTSTNINEPTEQL